MTRNPPPSSSEAEATSVTTETFQKHYGRGSGYPADPSHHIHPPPHPHHYPPSQYSSVPHAPPPYPPPGHLGGPPPARGHGYHHPPGHHQSWYYPPHAPAAPPAGGPPPEMAVSSSSHRHASRAAKQGHNVPPNLVTPKSHDSEPLPPVAADARKAETKKIPVKPSKKKINSSKIRSKKENNKMPTATNDKELEMEEEPKVEPMKQDFHFYAMDHFEVVKRESQHQLENSLANGSIPEKNRENELYLMTTLLNARLIQNWEAAPHSTHAQYLKKEEADRKRFMSEEEVASRHCATLTARRRSPKQSGGLGRMGSFGLTSAVEVPPLSPTKLGGLAKRPYSSLETGGSDSAVKRVKI